MHLALGYPATMLDLGCGIGAQCARLAELGWQVTGVDPMATNPELGFRFLKLDLLETNLTDFGSTFDTVVCTEMAEHIYESRSDRLISTIAALTERRLIWSAAPPGQMGQGHVNLQEPEYWLSKLATRDFAVDQAKTQRLREMMVTLGALHRDYATNFWVLRKTTAPNIDESWMRFDVCTERERLLNEAQALATGGAGYEAVKAAYLAVHARWPFAIEPLYWLGRAARLAYKQQPEAIEFLTKAMKLKHEDTLEGRLLSWRIQDELAMAEFELGNFGASLMLCSNLLADECAPKEEVVRLVNNFRHLLRMHLEIEEGQELLAEVAWSATHGVTVLVERLLRDRKD